MESPLPSLEEGGVAQSWEDTGKSYYDVDIMVILVPA